MAEEYESNRRLYLERDDEGFVRQLRPADRNRPTSAQLPQQAAVEFLTDNAEVLGIDADWLTGAGLGDAGEGIELRFDGEKRHFDSTTVTFQQTWRGIPVWRRGVTVTMRENPARVAAVQNTTYPEIDVDTDVDTGPAPPRMIARGLNIRVSSRRAPANGETPFRPEIVSDQRVVYRYDAVRRLTDFPRADEPAIPFPFPIPSPPDIPDGSFRLAREITFRVPTPPRGTVTWLAVVDVESGGLLYLRPFIANASGLVFLRDPMTAGSTAGPDATAATLNGFQTSESLLGLTAPAPGDEQALSGENVAVQDFEVFTVAPPTEPTGTNFDYGSRTNDFAAVNAYHHNDRFFRLVFDLGFSRNTFFNGTTFPVPVDHRGRFGSVDGIEINASCSGNGMGGIANVDYELAHLGDTTNPIGLAADWRVVLHELGGHGILYDHVNSANFGFAHSAGDSFAAVLSDPDTQAADRFVTFPWVALINRRHDRSIGAGWAWGGSNDVGGYSSEQILSTTHFRIYRSFGGDSGSMDMRRFAARVTAYLMLRAVSTLTPTTNPAMVTGWVTALLAADAGDWASAGLAGGAYGKVIRWAFEKQGLYQPPGAPTPVTTEGRPPAVDVYIDDGRHGEYQFQPVHWNNQNVWNRRFADNGTLHEDPWLGRTNFAYCRVRNRGTQTATGVLVKAYHCNPGAGLTWPNDWQAMTTAQLSVPDIPPGGEVTVGPFSWKPSQPDHECLLMIASASGDPSNVDAFGPGESIAEWRLVPHDNNIGQRNVHPVPAAGGVSGIVGVLDGRAFIVRNPFDVKAKVTIAVTLPPAMARKGWQVTISSPGAAGFGLAPGQARLVRLGVTPGDELEPTELLASTQRDVVVSMYANGILLGGMNYHLDPERAEPLPQDSDHIGDDCTGAARRLLRCLDIPGDRVKDVQLRSIGVDIELC